MENYLQHVFKKIGFLALILPFLLVEAVGQ